VRPLACRGAVLDAAGPCAQPHLHAHTRHAERPTSSTSAAVVVHHCHNIDVPAASGKLTNQLHEGWTNEDEITRYL